MGNAAPDAWATDKRRKIERYVRKITAVTTRSRDVLLPGVPVSAVFGFFANADLDENTTGWISCSDGERERAIAKGRKPLGGKPSDGYGHVASRNLHELGPGGVEGGHVPDLVATGDCAWVDGARSAGVAKVLGRPGVEGDDWYGAHNDQVAIACWNLARHSRQILTKLPEALRWSSDDDKPWDAWRWFCSMSSWSAGTGGTDKHLDRYADALAALPASRRVAAFLRLAGEVDDPGSRHTQDEYTALRGEQKVAAGRLAASLTGEAWALPWLDDGLGDDRAAVYARLVETT